MRLAYDKMRVLILASVISIACAQLPGLPDGLKATSPKPWRGPIADHKIGVHPGDTPEVAAAKAQHLNAYRQVLAVLPELPPEVRYQKEGLPLPAVIALQKQVHDQLNLAQAQLIQPVVQTHSPLIQHGIEMAHVPTVLAEDIPRSSIGEVPEVHAARVAHLKAVQEARDALLVPSSRTSLVLPSLDKMKGIFSPK